MNVVKFNTGKTVLFCGCTCTLKSCILKVKEHLDKVCVVGHRLHNLHTCYYWNIHLKIAWK